MEELSKDNEVAPTVMFWKEKVADQLQTFMPHEVLDKH